MKSSVQRPSSKMAVNGFHASKKMGVKGFPASKKMPVDGLPRYVAFKGNNGKYLGLGSELDDQYSGILKFEYEDLSSPYAKHEVVRDPSNEEYVQIKCCYNNKFWRRHSPSHWWISAGEDSINTDQSSWSCTLFAAKLVESANNVTLRLLKNVITPKFLLGFQQTLSKSV